MDFFKTEALRQWYAQLKSADDLTLCQRMLDTLQVKLDADLAELERVPLTGPAIVAGNHPFGMLEGPIVTSLLKQRRRDLRIVTNRLLGEIEELSELCIWVDPIRPDAALNSRALRQCLQWLRGGGLLAIFPAGAVSSVDLRIGRIVDQAWEPSVAWLARKTGASVTLLHLSGSNSLNFHLLGMMHASLRTAALPAELLNKKGARVAVRVGRPMSAAQLREFETDRAAADYLRSRTYLLAEPPSPANIIQFPSFASKAKACRGCHRAGKPRSGTAATCSFKQVGRDGCTERLACAGARDSAAAARDREAT